MHLENRWAALAAAAIFTMVATTASAETVRVQAASGHPWNNVARSVFNIFDTSVSLGGDTKRIWVVHFQLPDSATNVSGTWAGFTGPQAFTMGRLCTFNNSGNWVGCTAWSTEGNLGSIALPAGGTAFAQFELWGGGSVRHVKVTY